MSGQQEEIAKEGQTPGMPYEYCSTFHLMHSLIWAMQKTGEARYGDMFERTLFNAARRFNLIQLHRFGGPDEGWV